MGRGPSIPGYPSLTVGYPTEFEKGGIESRVGHPTVTRRKNAGMPAVSLLTGLGSCHWH